MKLDIKLKNENIQTFKKIIGNLKKTCSNQKIFITFDNNSIKLCTEYKSEDAQYIYGYYIMGNGFFLEDQKIESKKDNNLIQLLILDYNQFNQNISQINEESQQVSLSLTKNVINGEDKRYIKLKVQEEQGLDLSSQTEINLYFQEIFFPPSDNKLISFFLKCSELKQIFEIAAKKTQPVTITFNCSPIDGRHQGNLRISLEQPCIEINYSDIRIEQTVLTQEQSFQKTFKIHEDNAKQLSLICAIEEDVSINILDGDFNLYFEFFELCSSTDNTVMAIKSYVIPEYEDYDEDDIQKEEDVQDIKEEEMDDNDQHVNQNNENSALNDLNSDSE